MCGITGIVGPCPERGAVVTRMTDSLIHRGPDDSGFLHDEQFSFGQRRLSIIDLAGGRQPITNEDDRLVLVCNGEIYNSPELREQLIKKGHRFKTATDVEVILHLYEEHGRDCVRMLRGMFAFALWDRHDRRLLLARDHMGQKPLFFAVQGNTLYFASEVKAILASSKLEPRVDLEGLWHYMSLRFVPDRFSLFKDIQKLPAASILEW
jgi:asparagine synthase (glutamine-hydrolysing)